MILSKKRPMCFVEGQGQKYGQHHETKEVVEFHNHVHALTIVSRDLLKTKYFPLLFKVMRIYCYLRNAHLIYMIKAVPLGIGYR